jgi:hypothetical protein
VRLEAQLAFLHGFFENLSMIPRYVVFTLIVLNIMMLGAFLLAIFSPTLDLWMFAKVQSKICTQEIEGKTVFAFCPKE